MKIDYVDINKYDPKDSIEYFGGYNIKAWFNTISIITKGLDTLSNSKRQMGRSLFSETSTMRRIRFYFLLNSKRVTKNCS